MAPQLLLNYLMPKFLVTNDKIISKQLLFRFASGHLVFVRLLKWSSNDVKQYIYIYIYIGETYRNLKKSTAEYKK